MALQYKWLGTQGAQARYSSAQPTKEKSHLAV